MASASAANAFFRNESSRSDINLRVAFTGPSATAISIKQALEHDQLQRSVLGILGTICRSGP